MTTVLVGVGGLAGVLARYGLSRLTLHTEALIGTTVRINVVGSFLLGVLAAEQWFGRDVREALAWDFWAVYDVLDLLGADRAGGRRRQLDEGARLPDRVRCGRDCRGRRRLRSAGSSRSRLRAI